MNTTNVVRQKKHGSWFNWVHLSDGSGGAVCGRELAEETRIEPRADIELGNICKPCLQAELEYSVKTLQSGQVRRYGPSHYIYEVTDLRDEKRGKDEVLADCRRIIKKAYLKSDPSDNPANTHFRPTIKGFDQTGKGVWRYFVLEESTH